MLKKNRNNCIYKENKNTTGGSIKVGGKIIESKQSVKCLCIMIDSHLNIQDEVKKFLKKMACGIKTLAAIQKLFDIQTHLLLLQSLVFSHLHYSSVVLSGISQKLILSLDKQINCALKTITYRKKYESSRFEINF